MVYLKYKHSEVERQLRNVLTKAPHNSSSYKESNTKMEFKKSIATMLLLSHIHKTLIISIAMFSAPQHWFRKYKYPTRLHCQAMYIQNGNMIVCVIDPFLCFISPIFVYCHFPHLKCKLSNSFYASSLTLFLLSFLSASAPLQVHQNNVSGHPEPQTKGEPATLLLGHDVRVCRCQHAPSTGDISGKRSTAGAPALHHDPEEPGRNATV